MEYSGKAMSQDFVKYAGFYGFYERPIARNGKAYVFLVCKIEKTNEGSKLNYCFAGG